MATNNWYPFNPNLGQKFQTNVPGVEVDGAYVAHFCIPESSAKAASNSAVHSAITCSTAKTTVESGFTNPPVARNITATAGGTEGDIKAVQVKAFGKDIAGNDITEELPAFTADTAGTVTGNKAFASVSKVEIPAMDGAGATVSVGYGSKLGLPYMLAHNTVLMAFLDNSREGTAPTVAVSATDISGNTVTLNSALVDSKQVDVYLVV